MNPRVISADWHDRYVNFAIAPQFFKTVRHSSVTSENHARPSATAGLEQVAVVAPIRVPLFARAPVFYRERNNVHLVAIRGLEIFPFVPIELGHAAESSSSQ